MSEVSFSRNFRESEGYRITRNGEEIRIGVLKISGSGQQRSVLLGIYNHSTDQIPLTPEVPLCRVNDDISIELQQRPNLGQKVALCCNHSQDYNVEPWSFTDS